MYKLIGSDQKTYGPVTAEQIRQWIAEGRVTSSTLIQGEASTEWKPISTFPEFAQPPVPSLPPTISVPPPTHTAVGNTPYESNSMATAGFIFGILSVIPCCCFSFLFAILGIVFSIIALNRANHYPNQNGKVLAIVGLVCSVLGLVGGLLFQIFFGYFSRNGGWESTWHF
jgi:hypothetical protein